MAESVSIRTEDVMPVRSRVSWGPIFAGATLALGVYLVLTLVGGAIGLSVSDNVKGGTLGTGAAVWAVLTTVVALFAGGWVASQLSVGESKGEATMYGLLVWGLVFAMFLWLVGTGVRAGFNAMVGMAHTGAVVTQNTTQQDWEAGARRAGLSQSQIDDMKVKIKDAPASAREAVENPENQQAVKDAATHVTWWTLLGTLLSMAAAVGGSLFGAGPTFRLLSVSESAYRPGMRTRQPAGTV